MFKRHFLTRRRYDALALALAFALLATLDNGSKILFGAFVFAGVYLVLGRHRSVRRAPLAFSAALLAYGAWTIALTLLRGEPFVGNRQLGFGLISILFAFLPMGLVLVARPLRAAVCGARIAVVVVSTLAVVEYGITGVRVGLGANAALFAFVVAALGVLARIPVGATPRLLPDSRLWLYLTFIPVVLSETRAAFALYVLALLLDLVRLARRGEARASLARLPVLVGAAVLVVVTAVPAFRIITRVAERAVSDYAGYAQDVPIETSIGIRMAMWQGGFDVLSESPLVGVGAMSRIAAVAERMPASSEVLLQFAHLHNLILDEVLSNGLIGLALMFAIFIVFLRGVFAGTREWSMRESAILLVFLVFTFGSFHGVMLNETTLITMLAIFSVMLCDLRRPYRRRVGPAGQITASSRNGSPRTTRP